MNPKQDTTYINRIGDTTYTLKVSFKQEQSISSQEGIEALQHQGQDLQGLQVHIGPDQAVLSVVSPSTEQRMVLTGVQYKELLDLLRHDTSLRRIY